MEKDHWSIVIEWNSEETSPTLSKQWSICTKLTGSDKDKAIEEIKNKISQGIETLYLLKKMIYEQGKDIRRNTFWNKVIKRALTDAKYLRIKSYRRQQNTVGLILKKDNQTIHDPEEIIKTIFDFYRNKEMDDCEIDLLKLEEEFGRGNLDIQQDWETVSQDTNRTREEIWNATNLEIFKDIMKKVNPNAQVGKDKIANSTMKNSPEEVQELYVGVVKIIRVLRKIYSMMGEITGILIPKGNSDCRILENTRRIAMMSSLLKVAQLYSLKEQTVNIESEKFYKGQMCGRKGIEVTDIGLIENIIICNAQKYNQKFWAILWDEKECFNNINFQLGGFYDNHLGIKEDITELIQPQSK